MSTYTYGPELRFTESVKKSDYIQICDLIAQGLSELPKNFRTS